VFVALLDNDTIISALTVSWVVVDDYISQSNFRHDPALDESDRQG